MVGNTHQFESLIREHASVIAAAVRRVCMRRYESLVPDVTQEVHLKLWKVLESGKKIENPPSYLYRVALTTGLTMVEQARRQRALTDRFGDEPTTQRSADAAGPERARLIEELLATLDTEHANALRAYLAGYNHVEVAELFGWTESVARHRVYRGFEKLRKYMQDQEISLEGGQHG